MENTKYTPQEFIRDYDAALKTYTVPGYPSYNDRLRLDNYDPQQIPYDQNAPWCLPNYYRNKPGQAPLEDRFRDRGDIYPPTPEEASLWNEFGLSQDQRQMPLHPFAKQMLLGAETPEGEFVRPGAVVTPGYYYGRGYGRGPQKTADMLLLAPDNGKLHGLVIERSDSDLLAIPGGHIDEEDRVISRQMQGALNEYEVGGIRELAEETSMHIDPKTLTCSGLSVVLKKIWAGPGADQRATIHAWPQGEAFAAILPAIPSAEPAAQTDAKSAKWLPMDQETLERLAQFSCHGTIGKRSITAYEQANGVSISPDGTIL